MRPFLRDGIADRAAWHVMVEAVREAGEESDDERGRRLSRLGELLRLDPATASESVAVLQEALTLLHEARPLAIAQLRMANSLQYANRHREALGWFEKAESTVRAAHLRGLRDLIEQHRGKCLAELGRYEEARRAFQAALRLRSGRERPDRGLIASTERALAALPPGG